MHLTRLVGIPLPSTLSPKHLPPTRTSFRLLNWTMVNAPYVRLKSRYLRGPSRFNRAPTDLIRFLPTGRRHPGLLSRGRSHSALRVAVVEPLVCVPKKSGGIRITVNYQKLNKVTEIPQIAIPRVDEVLDTLDGGPVFSVFDLFSEFTQLTIHLDTIP